MIMSLYSEGLLSKWGFEDGDMPENVWDAIEEAGLDFMTIDWHGVLRSLVRDYLLPALDQHVEVYDIETIHNPIRAKSVDGVAIPDAVIYGRLPEPVLTPEAVEIPMDEVVRRCRTMKEELGSIR